MSLTIDAIWAASPSTTRGQPTPLSADSKGERIAYASNKSIFVRSIDKPEISKQYTAHTAQTTVARFSPSGFYVASGDTTGSVRVWDSIGAETTKGEYHIIAGRINDIAWDGDSQRIIAVGDGKERFGHCITADSGNTVGEISGQSSQINCVSIRQQRPYRAATGSDDTTVAFYHGTPFKFNTSLRGNHNKFVYGTAFSPDGATLLSVGSDKKIWQYDGKSGEVKQQIGEGEHKGSIFAVSWSSDSKEFATASADQTIKIWDVESGKAKQSWRMGGDGIVSVPDQQVGIVWPHGRSDGLVISVDLGGNLNYFQKGSPNLVKTINGHQGSITAATASNRDSPTLWTGSYEGRIRAWDVSKGLASPIDGEQHSSYVSGLTTTADEARIYSIGWDDALRSIDAQTLTFSGSASKCSGQPKEIVSSEDKILVSTPTAIEIFSASDGQKASTFPTKGYTATALAAHGAAVVTGGDDKTLRIHLLSGSTLAQTHAVADATTSTITTLAFSPSGAHLAVGTAGGGITVFKTDSWEVETRRWSAHAGRVTCIAWRADGKVAASASLDTHVFVWSLAAPGKRVKAGNAHKDGASAVVWVGEGTVVSAGADAAVKVWKVEGVE